MAERFLAERFNRPGLEVVDHHTWAICSDGDMMEGISQEAASLAGHFALGKLVVCYDDNRITIDGTTALSFDGENHTARLAADGWHVQRVADSEDVGALEAALVAARAETERPSFISVRSHIAFPAPHAVDTAKSHGAALGEEEVRATKEVMGFDPDAHFAVDPQVYEEMDLRPHGVGLQVRWEERFAALAAGAARGRRRVGPRLGRRAGRGLARGAAPLPHGQGPRHPRRGTARRWRPSVPSPPRWSAAPPTWSSPPRPFSRAPVSSRACTAGRNVPFGIREHAMGAVVNGLCAHGGIVKPYGSTFLVFSDYMRGAVRLSALMELPVVWVWTHDSVALGEDGPTHQPVEHYAALRAIPHLWVVRPADANETAEAWRVALERPDGPVALLLSRQGIPVLARDGEGLGAASELERGGYVLWDSGPQSCADPDCDRRRGCHHAGCGPCPRQ